MINFCDEMTIPVNNGRAVDIVCRDFCKAFDTVYCRIFADKQLLHGLGEQTVRQIKNQLKG